MDSNLKVVKRNGDIVNFSIDKIAAAIGKAYKACDLEDIENIGLKIAIEIQDVLIKIGIKEASINQIQDMVESRLMKLTSEKPYIAPIARRYIIYRDRRDKDRFSINKLSTTFHDIIEVEDNDVKKSNANINGNTPAGQMMIFASESSKQHAFDYIVNPKHVQAHKSGYIHIHDADYISTKAVNCNQIDLVELFKKPFIYTEDAPIRKPKRISSYTALAAIVLQSEQNENFGGQSIHSWDYAMAAGVRDSFLENFRKYEDLFKENTLHFRDSRVRIGNEDLIECYPRTYRLALEDTIHQTHEAIAAFIYNMCSMHSRG